MGEATFANVKTILGDALTAARRCANAAKRPHNRSTRSLRPHSAAIHASAAALQAMIAMVQASAEDLQAVNDAMQASADAMQAMNAAMQASAEARQAMIAMTQASDDASKARTPSLTPAPPRPRASRLGLASLMRLPQAT